MAQKIQTIITIVDDLDGSQEATTSRTFDVGTRRFAIDLCDSNADQFDADFREWTTGLKKRTFAIGRKSYTRWLRPDEAERFDAAFREWTTGLKERTFAVGQRSYTRWLPPDEAEQFDLAVSRWIKAAKRVSGNNDEEPPESSAPGRGREPLETIVPVPVKGQQWELDPPRPISRATTRAFNLARRTVRNWARNNGWPDLGERGRIPREAYERWVDEVWLAMDDPSWERLEQQPVPAPASARSRKPRRRN
ncbi:Lsr2 dimerization domain-containing protein [Amycolatopsis vastitatis]|uniref:Lsr2 dimerization domain-containing protein n=1 Tax=Amycolatopsis vastitatis TaxID=1905142 RepID=A0A229TFA8_9PSEU|nr:histone-like nucleoid-structuring protein Lsr2 [Amycolatopsis vastitatis]OXM69594.1 hypothetical protein CF165_08785 [Amycolatopsis vastitatis]